MKTTWIAWPLLAAVLWWPAPAAASAGTVFIDSRLVAWPAFNARVVAEVPADTRVTIEEEQGLWLRVAVQGGPSGWIRRFDVRTADQARAAEKSSGGGLFGLFSGSSRRPDRVTNTIGIRGLDAVDINNARSDHREVARLDDYRAGPPAAERLAEEGGLESRDVAYVAGESGGREERGSDSGGFNLNF